MKKRILVALSLLLVVSTVFVFAHYKAYLGKRPCDQPGTTWKSDDGNIIFSFDEFGAGTGWININDEWIAVAVAIGPATGIDVYPSSAVVDDGEGRRLLGDMSLEHWLGTFKKDSEFTAEVKESTYYSIGDKIHFYRVD